MVMKKFVLCFFLVLFVGMSFAFAFESRDFEVDGTLLKMVVRGGEVVNKNLKVTSYSGGVFTVDKNGLDFVSVNNSFSLGSGGEKVLELEFSSDGMEPGIYFGEVLISSGKVVSIPIIFEVESDEVFFDSSINVPLEYNKIYVGGNVVVENRIFNLENIGLRNVEVHYFISDFKGDNLFSEDENLAVGTQVVNTKVVPISKNIVPGDYLFGVILKYGDSVGTSSYFFRVSENEVASAKNDESYFLWVVIFLLIGLVFFIIYYLKQRDKIFLELNKQYKKEIARQKSGKIKPKELKKRLVVVKKIYKERVRVVKKLKKQKRVDKVKNKLEQWKKEGYNVNEFVASHESPKENLGKRVKRFRGQGYKW